MPIKSGIAIAVIFAWLLVMFSSSVAMDRPPTNALRRIDPEKYEIKFGVVLEQTAATSNTTARGIFSFLEAPIIFPVIYSGSYNRVFPKSESGHLFMDGAQIPDNELTRRIQDNKPFNTHQFEMIAPKFSGTAFRWEVKYTTQSWSSQINEQLAQQSTWPRDMKWPDEVKDGLSHQKYIESNNAQISSIFKQAFGDSLKNFSPYIAAKKVIGKCLNNFQKNGNGEAKGRYGKLQGLNVKGALATINNADQLGRWIGTEHDLVCVCVAMLRVAGIPARPVIGITERRARSGKKSTVFISWAEFYLPGSGWVPFDPDAMISKGAAQYKNLQDNWPEFGTMEELNERIPLSYHFIPPNSGAVTPGFAAVWGWDPRPAQKYYEQYINLGITGKGKGIKDPD